MSDFQQQLSAHRSDLLRHCYRMLGAFADAEDLVQETLLRAWKARDSYTGDAPLSHWLMRIATNACLNELESRKRRGLPQLDVEAAVATAHVRLDPSEVERWLTPAPDAKLFPEPAQAAETRESVALAFLALLQRLPARQRAVFLLKDVLGWSVAETAEALDMSESAVSSALHRARETVGAANDASTLKTAREFGSTARASSAGGASERASSAAGASDPAPEVLQAYLRCWERHDIDALLTLMRDDIVFAMPPYAAWFRGRPDLERFLRGVQFTDRWAAGFRTRVSRANGCVAVAFYRGGDERGDGANNAMNHGRVYRLSSLQVVRFVENRVVEIVSFIGPEYLRGFELPEQVTGTLDVDGVEVSSR
jgi:RNA polymerase sigma-70 factor (ECF subfamily)